MLPVLPIGPLAVQTPGLLLLLGVWFGGWAAEKQAPRFGLDANAVSTLVLVSLLAGVLGARGVYAARFPAAFAANPLALLSLSPQLLDPTGGLLVAGLAALIYQQRARLPLWPLLDALSAFAAVLAVAVPLANFASGDAYGATSHLPWAIELWGQPRHPVQLYEALAALLILVLLFGGRGSPVPTRPGQCFWTFLASSAGARLFFEAFRAESPLLLGQVRQAQVLAWLLLAFCLWQLLKHAPEELP